MRTYIKIVLVILYIFWCAVAGAQPVQGYMRYRYLDVESALGLPSDTTDLSPAQKLKPHISVKSDSILYLWSVVQQRYILPKGSGEGGGVTFADILGPVSGNVTLRDSLLSKQQKLPYNGSSGYYLGGDHLLHNLDSLLSAMDFVKSTDTVFLNVSSGTADSLHFTDPLYRYGEGGKNIGLHYDYDVFNALKLRGWFVASNVCDGCIAQADSVSHSLKWRHIDSLGVVELDEIALAALADSAAAIRAAFPVGSIANTNIGSGYRWLKPAGQEIKTAFAGYGMLIDSTSNTNGLTFGVDSNLVATKARLYKVADSLAALIGSGGTAGIDDVLAVGQALTSGRFINPNSYFIALSGSRGTTYLQENAININATSTANSPLVVGWAGSSVAASIGTEPPSTNSVIPAMELYRNTSDTAADGIGVSLRFAAETTTGKQESNSIVSKWTNATDATRTSQLDITGVNNASTETFANFQTGGIVLVNNLADTLATRAYARSVGGGGSTPTFQQILTAGSAVTTSNTITGSSGNAFNIEMGTSGSLYGFLKTQGGATTIGSQYSSNRYANINVVASAGLGNNSVQLAAVNLTDAGGMVGQLNIYDDGKILINGFLNLNSQYTPSSSGDTGKPISTLTTDNDYLYYRAPSDGLWRRIAWVTF